jgi:hypothetical protein
VSQCKRCGAAIGGGQRGPARIFCSQADDKRCYNARRAATMQLCRRRHFTFSEDIPAETRRERSQPVHQTGLEATLNGYGTSSGRRPTYGRRFVDTFRGDNSAYVRRLEERIEDANGDAPELEEKLRRAREARRLFEGEAYFRRLFDEGRL